MYNMIESRRNFINTDNVKALMSMEDVWKRAAVAQVDLECKRACRGLEVLEHRALTVQSHDAGSVKTLVNLPPSHPNWQEVSILRARVGRCWWKAPYTITAKWIA